MIPAVLSTKLLSQSQGQLLLNAGISFVHFPFIKTVPVKFDLESLPDYLIVTSQNAVKALLESSHIERLMNVEVFCISPKTEQTLRTSGFKIAESAPSAEELAQIILKQYNKSRFTFLCGNIRRDTLPSRLRQEGITLHEIPVYQTDLNPRKFYRHFDAVLFFSPSAAQSFFSQNDLSGATAFCIGGTTASLVRQHTQNVVLANRKTVENVIVQVVKRFRTKKG